MQTDTTSDHRSVSHETARTRALSATGDDWLSKLDSQESISKEEGEEDLFSEVSPMDEDDFDAGDLQLDDVWNDEDHGDDVKDLASSIAGIYRILDLISERGSGGLVDKIVIAQESLARFIADVSPGAYTSMTRIDFALLDQLQLRPVGLYGSKEELVRFLLAKGAFEEEMAAMLLRTPASATEEVPKLRSGLYLFKPTSPGHEDMLYVVYWPEDTTWDDDAMTSVQRNRVTFIRYLTKLADDIVALISRPHLDTLVWKDEDEEDEWDSDDDQDEREYNFEVSKSEEQDENVLAKSGFMLTHPAAVANHDGDDAGVDLRPYLIAGETQIGLMELCYMAPVHIQKPLREQMYSMRLRSFIQSCSFQLDLALSPACLEILIRHGLHRRAPDAVGTYKQAQTEIQMYEQAALSDKMAEMRTGLEADADHVIGAVHATLARHLEAEFTLQQDSLCSTNIDLKEGSSHEYLDHLQILFPDIRALVDMVLQEKELSIIPVKEFSEYKKRIIMTDKLLAKSALPEDAVAALVDAIMGKDDHFPTLRDIKLTTDITAMLPWGDRFLETIVEVHLGTVRISDKSFLRSLEQHSTHHPSLRAACERARMAGCGYLQATIARRANLLATDIRMIREREMIKQIRKECEINSERDLRSALHRFLQSVQHRFQRDRTRQLWVIERLDVHARNQADFYRIIGVNKVELPARIRHVIHPLHLTAEDRQALQTVEGYVPSPRIHPRSSTSLKLDMDNVLLHTQLLAGGKCLLVIADDIGNIRIYLEYMSELGEAVFHKHHKKFLHHERIGQAPLVAFDETKRTLALLPASSELRQLYLFVFDERHGSLQALGAPIRVGDWYDSTVFITHIAIVCGSAEELVLVDNSGQARIFSWVTQQFRPNVLELVTSPQAIFTSPDGSCLFVLTQGSLLAYHWSAFGSTAQGIPVALPGTTVNAAVLTSFGARNNIHFAILDRMTGHLQSIAMTITHKVTEFSFKEKHGDLSQSLMPSNTKHNSLIDCHSEVWTRFPVLPALKQKFMSSGSGDTDKSLLFVADHSWPRFRVHFKSSITAFQKRTRKPTEDELEKIRVKSMDFTNFAADKQYSHMPNMVSAGQWLVSLLCLIPIHIALTHDNRFIPLKDGVWSADYERSLAGARVDQIVDSISFGWYESIFKSYMANKPVKVVSSMGEQSVGKSFALNHLVDTSFAGSAMRTTEGVWMSVNPTANALIVALDFEGVHSIERSAQEDALLVLFNTAISNLVLFRNNFAVSRDIASLFQSFQSSSAILDPAANPNLFCSKLVIIIKDVVQSDKDDIKKEFQLKFQQIVEMEQGGNFITKLHKNQIAIIPWPVIESKQFYTLFKRLKQNLDDQPISHDNAVIFLHTVKTLMAKLKANDWGSLSQNLVAHRVRQLMALLPSALAFGLAELQPVIEHLKNMDTGELIPTLGDTGHRFILNEIDHDIVPEERQDIMEVHRMSWTSFSERSTLTESSWYRGLVEHLNGLAEGRLSLVKLWVESNLVRFADHKTASEILYRELNAMSVDLKTSLALCGMQCANCQLICIQPNRHDELHNCMTSHRCPRPCSYSDDHSDEEACGLPAGHAGQHICNISAHLCGKGCSLSDKNGCLQRCAKPLNHEGNDHMCPAEVHECSRPCSLQAITTADGQRYSCMATCRVPSHEPHDRHMCEVQGCPLRCQLCKRTCRNTDHLHGLDHQVPHLCGESHPCSALCQAPGVCQIETTPHSMDATFTGKHGAFQYTKYSQSAKRMPCVLSVPAGRIVHNGIHQHTVDEDHAHHCETQCDNCGYYCTLPLGHPQVEHETSHGSMSRTRWALGADAGEGLTVNGHNFGAEDEGAPMLCSLVCKSMGRHVHVDYCRESCTGSTDLQHIHAAIAPDPEKPKDWVTHNLHWKRTGFKDPYTQEERADFARCDAMCNGPEHREMPNAPARPSYCRLPLFHTPATVAPGGIGYISSDGHSFLCADPGAIHQAFHVLFLIDKSQSMGLNDRRPLPNTPITARIAQRHNNRLGAVFSALHGFWSARQPANSAAGHRRDAYTVILFDENVTASATHDTASSPDQLLAKMLPHVPQWRTNFQSCLDSARDRMRKNWHNQRTPVVVLLSDGEADVPDASLRRLCREAVTLGKPISFHAVSFGPQNVSLRRMVDIAAGFQNTAPVDHTRPTVPSSYSEALDTVQLAQTFLGIADSLHKPRGALMRV